MGELWPSQPGSKPLSTSDDRQFAKCLLPARPSSAGSAGYITDKKQCDVKGGESPDSDPDEAQTGAFDWRAYYPPPAEAADEDVVIGASQSEDEDDRSLAQRWPGLWRGATRGGGRGSADESEDEKAFQVQHPAGGSCVLNQNPVVEVQHPAEGTCAQDEDLVEHPVELTCTQDRVVGMGHVVQGALDESCLPAQAKDGDGCSVKGAWGDGSFYRRQRGSPLGPGSDARARFSQEEYDVIINNSIGACCSKLPGEGTLHPESEGSTSEDNDSFSGQTYKFIELKDDCSRGASEVFDPSEIEDSCDSAPGYSVIDTHNESTDLFDDNLADLAQQVESDDDLIPFQPPKQDSAYQGVVNVAPRYEDRSSFNSSIGDSWVPASMKQLSGANSLTEIKNCNFNLMRSEEVNVCTQIQSENNQGEEFVVDIEAEALHQFTYHEVDTISRDERHSDLLQNKAHGDDAEHMSGNPKLSLQDDLEVSRSSSSSPNRDIDALYLTQCAPLKRKASFRGEKHPATKKTRRSWEQWYQQFKTIVETGREKLTAQNSQILTDEKKKSLNPFSIESDSSYSVNVVDSYEIHNQPTTFLMRQSCVGKLEPVNYDSQDNESDDEIQPSNVTVNDQLVPEQNNVDRINSSCNKKKLLDLKKPLFGWSSVEPSLKGVNDFPPRDSMRTTEMLRTPPMTQRPVRVGLSKRAHPKPLHVRRQWWALSAVREICAIQ